MRAATFMFVCCFFCVIFLSGITQAQSSLTHNTGTLEVTIIDNGYIGDHLGLYGGVVFNGNQNAMYTAGILAGDMGQAYGNIGSFLIEDFQNLIPITGFFSDANFNEIAYHTVVAIINPESKSNIISLSNTGHDFVFLRAEVFNNVSGVTDFHGGIFADWDVGDYTLNRGGYVPSKNLFYMYENGGGTDASYYGVMGINQPSNTIMGTIIGDFSWTRELAFTHMTSTAFDTITTDGDYRMFLSFGPFSAPPGEKVRFDFAIVAGTSLVDLLVNADSAIFYGQYVPVELTSFTATTQTGKVTLNWTTATEINNLGFEIERKIINNENQGEWVRIGFREGYGTTTETKEYSYVDNISGINATSLAYRLKQLDFDGRYEYSDEVLIENPAPVDYALQQNYPNPFNPTTTIKYSIPVRSDVVLKVFNTLGSEVEVLVNELKESGTHKVEISASSLPSGIYFYQLQAGDFVETKKMVLLK